jgi:hypothetical protein
MSAHDAGHDAASHAQDAGHDAGVDAGIDAGFGGFACNPLTQLGCGAGERCAWVDSGGGGDTKCLAQGSAAESAACTRNGDGEDNCKSGLYCANDKCQKICDLTDRDSCGANRYCVHYAGVFEQGANEFLAGVCTDGCDPVTQQMLAGGDCGTNKGCFLQEYKTHAVATCASATQTTKTQGVPITGSVFANSCAAGFTAAVDKDGNAFCTAFCKPVETWSGSKSKIGGDSPNDCAARGAGGAYECHFAWAFSPIAEPDPMLNNIGICFDPTGRQYDANGHHAPDTDWPSCGDLSNTEMNFSGVPDHLYWGCAPMP